MTPPAKTQTSNRPHLRWEKKFGFPARTVLGVDEVGRGCLAGPVVAAAVALPLDASFRKYPWLKEVADSKLLSPEKRQELAPQIERFALASSIASASVEEIDDINIFHAAHLAMVRACEDVKRSLGHQISQILIDGKFLPEEFKQGGQATAIVKGDTHSLSIACASILAKVWRDHEMAENDVLYPGYGFSNHKGYSTPEHQESLRQKGPCGIHRRSFAPVAALIHGTGAGGVASLPLFDTTFE